MLSVRPRSPAWESAPSSWRTCHAQFSLWSRTFQWSWPEVTEARLVSYTQFLFLLTCQTCHYCHRGCKLQVLVRPALELGCVCNDSSELALFWGKNLQSSIFNYSKCITSITWLVDTQIPKRSSVNERIHMNIWTYVHAWSRYTLRRWIHTLCTLWHPSNGISTTHIGPILHIPFVTVISSCRWYLLCCLRVAKMNPFSTGRDWTGMMVLQTLASGYYGTSWFIQSLSRTHDQGRLSVLSCQLYKPRKG